MTCRYSVDATFSIPAVEMARGAIWCWGQQGDMHVEAVATGTDGRLYVTAKIVSGQDTGHRDVWAVNPGEFVDIHDPAAGRVVYPN